MSQPLPDRRTVTEADILAATAALGVEVSARQLKRWRREGLLPAPLFVRGRGRGKGVEAHYPARALLQAMTAARLVPRLRRFPDVRWAMWACGFDLTARVRRDLIEAWRSEHRAYNTRYRAHMKAAESDDVSLTPLEQLARKSRRLPHVAQLNRRVGREKAATYLAYEHAARLGVAPENGPQITADDAPVLTRALAALDAWDEPVKNEKKPDVAALRVAWEFVGQHVNFQRVGHILATCPPAWMEQLRAEVDTLARHLGLLSSRTDDLIQPDWFLQWFTLRSALGELSESFARWLDASELPRPQSPPFLRTVLVTHRATRRDRRPTQ